MANSRIWRRFALGVVLALAAALHFIRLSQTGYNLYYAAAVKSMLMSGRNLFFASFDPAGFVSVDKPLLGLWVQAASAALLGLSGLSLILPQAIAGVLSILLLYHLVGRVYGATAGVLAALVLAVTPISVAANRNNTMDSLLVLTSLLAAWAASLATERGRLRWLLACAVLVGVGFNIKMLQAVMVLPAFWLLYLAAAPLAWWRRLAHLALATIILVAVSLAWIIVVDLTPPEERPYVGSSRNNSELELIVGHNGLERLGIIANWLGLRGPVRPGPRLPGLPPGAQPDPPLPGGQPNPPPLPAQRGNPARGPMDETGQPGVLRLFNPQLAGQASWLLPLALLGLPVVALHKRPSRRLAHERRALLLWGAWLVPQVAFFSAAGLFHRYYLEMLSPAIAALAGAGIAALWDGYRRGLRRGWLLPLALVGSAAVEVSILARYPDWGRWLTSVVVGLALLAAFALVVLRLRPASLLSTVFCAVGMLALLVAPAAWSVTPLLGSDGALPFAGPELMARGFEPRLRADVRLVDYLRANRAGETFLVAALNAQVAAPLILTTGEAVIALGGFGGGDPILTVDQLATRVEEHQVRFFLLPQRAEQQVELVRWVNGHCAPVPPQLWLMPSPPGQPQPGGDLRLVDCAARATSP